MNDVYKKYGNMSFQELKEYTHSLPEFEESGETSTPISWTTLFNITGWDGEDLIAIKDEMRVMLFYDKLKGKQQETISNELLYRMRAGLCKSKRTSKIVKEFYRKYHT